MSELRVSRLFGARLRSRTGPGAPNQNVFIDGRKQPGRQHRLAVIGRRVSSMFEIPYVKWQPLKAQNTHTHTHTHTHIRPPQFLPSRGFKRSQMCHGEAITPLFVLVLIKLVKCSQAWPGVDTLLPVVPVARCNAPLQPAGPLTPLRHCPNSSTVSGEKPAKVQ